MTEERATDGEKVVVRAAFLWVLSLFLIYVLSIGLAYEYIAHGFYWCWRCATICLVWGPVYSLIVITVLILYFTVEVRTGGIYGCNVWGKYRFVTWERMLSARPINLLGFRYVRLFTDDKKSALWIALFLSQPERFKGAIRRFAPEDNPLRRFFFPQGA